MNTGIQDAYNLAWKLAVALTPYHGSSNCNTAANYSMEVETRYKHHMRKNEDL